MLLPLILALGQYVDQSSKQTVPDTVPLYCYNSSAKPEPLVGTNFGMLRRAFLERFELRAQMYVDGPAHGLLRFSDKDHPDGVVNFDVVTYTGDRGPGLVLMRMRTQLNELNNNGGGNNFCWLVFGVVNDR